MYSFWLSDDKLPVEGMVEDYFLTWHSSWIVMTTWEWEVRCVRVKLERVGLQCRVPVRFGVTGHNTVRSTVRKKDPKNKIFRIPTLINMTDELLILDSTTSIHDIASSAFTVYCNASRRRSRRSCKLFDCARTKPSIRGRQVSSICCTGHLQQYTMQGCSIGPYLSCRLVS